MRKRKTVLCIALSLIMVVSAVYVAYQQPKQVKAAVVIDDAIVIAGILAACGVVYVGATKEEELKDAIGKANGRFTLLWEEAIDEVSINIGGSNWEPTNFDPDEDDPNEKPPKWQALIEWIKAHPEAKLFMQGTALASVFLRFANLLKDDVDNVDNSNFASCTSNASPYFSYLYKGFYYPTQTTEITKKYNEVVSDGTFFGVKVSSDSETVMFNNKGSDYKYLILTAVGDALYGGLSNNPDDAQTMDNIAGYYETSYGHSTGYNFNVALNGYATYYINPDYTVIYNGEIVEFETVLTADNTKFGSTLQTDENGDITALPVPSINVQNFADTFEENYTELGTALEEEDETKTQAAVDTIIESVGKTETETDPDTGTDTEPGTGTTPGTGTDTDTNTGTGSDMTVEDAQQNLDKNQFLLPETITEKFPFCVPFDIIRAFQLFNSDTRTAPRVELPLKSDSYGIDEKIVIDLKEFDEVAELLRTLELIGFIVALALVSRDLIKG